jgi:pimeloyl-ACP methyl ester carboxylesterase
MGELADRWKLERLSVVGYSSGGKYALACAAALPGRVALAAVVAAPGPPQMPGFRANMTRLDRVSMTLAPRAAPAAAALWRPIRRIALSHPERLLARLERGVSEADRGYLADPAARRALLASIQEGLRPGVGGVVDEYAIEARPWGFDLAQVGATVRIWHGDQDTIVPLAHSTYLAAAVPGAELRVLPGMGHFLGRGVDDIAAALAAA